MNLERYYSEGMFELGRLVPLRSKKHLEWVASQPCVFGRTLGLHITNETMKVDAHHQERRRGGTANDYTCIPLQHSVHMEYHTIGHESFEEKYGVDMRDMLIAVLIERVRSLEERLK